MASGAGLRLPEPQRRVALLASCGLTVHGELIAPQPGGVVSITADKTVRFIRG